jgi:polar amino acid transport system substrate-binding protein
VIETIKEEGVICIGLSIFTPWSMRDVNDELIGFELDVGRELAKDMGVDVEFVPTAWDGIIPQLVAGNFDVIISGMTITPARNLTVNFTQPYAYSGLTILANKEMTDGFTLEDYNSPEVTCAARPPPPLHSCSQRRHCCCLTKTVPRPKKC